jgi:BolA family transcriptional regulator, general stress-responsive regulator
MNLAAAIRERLAVLAPESIELTDDSGQHVGHEGSRDGGSHFSLVIVSPRFAGMKTLSRHRLVYEAMGPLMHQQIHALAIRALTPDEL